MTTINDLPNDILTIILKKTSYNYSSVMKTCTRFASIIKKDALKSIIAINVSRQKDYISNFLLRSPTETQIIQLLEYNPRSTAILGRLPPSLQTSQIAHICVCQNADSFRYIRDDLITIGLCWIAVKQSCLAIKYVPIKFQTPEICIFVVKTYGNVFEYISKYNHTHELCLEAVKSSGCNLKHVSPDMQTEEMCILALRHNYGASLGDVANPTPAIYMAAVKNNGYNIRHVPPQFITEELQMVAVTNHGDTLKFIPTEEQTVELILAAYISYPSSCAHANIEIIKDYLDSHK